MKKITLICSVFVSAYLSAQTFTDNFDSYTAGQKLAQQSAGAWTTWSNAPGGTEDGVVSNANAASAPNSMYFSSNVQGGGPVDQIKHFGVLNTGTFSLEWNMFVETGKAGYFNLQKTATLGQTWALNANFNDDGTLTLDDAVVVNLSTTYTQNTWFNFRLDINFNTNHWELFINDVSQGSFANSVNQVEAIDIFPVDQNTPFASGFYIDDFTYTITPYTLPNLNLAATYVSFAGANLTGSTVTEKVKVRNLGTSAINSFDITTNYNGNNSVQNVTGLNLASLAETEITITNPLVLVSGSHVLSATVSNVNGTANDGDANDNTSSMTINPINPALGKVVVGEEGTGTWCQWCPRGAVFMDKMESTYGDKWIGIAVHNNDPMTVAVYDAGIGALISGYPTALVDRTNAIDPSAMEADFLDRITQAPTAFISNTATYDANTRLLTVTVSADFQAAANSNYKLACVLTEDAVTGTTTQYNQSNAYAGGASGVMGGFETKPNPVPAAQMVYDHVARAIAPSFEGMANSFPATVNAGEVHAQTFTFTLASDWDVNEIHIIGLLIDPNGKVDNAGKINLGNLSVIETEQNTIQFYPNPSSDVLNFTVNKSKITSVKIISLDGKVLKTEKVNALTGSISVSDLNAGMYQVEFNLENGLKTSKPFVKN